MNSLHLWESLSSLQKCQIIKNCILCRIATLEPYYTFCLCVSATPSSGHRLLFYGWTRRATYTNTYRGNSERREGESLENLAIYYFHASWSINPHVFLVSGGVCPFMLRNGLLPPQTHFTLSPSSSEQPSSRGCPRLGRIDIRASFLIRMRHFKKNSLVLLDTDSGK